MQTVEEAFRTIDTAKEGIPFEAIEYLYNHESTPEITEKIIFALENAYNDDVYYDEAEDRSWNTPLWYAIAAENHLSEALIDPVISLFVTTEDVWDFLNEQGSVLIGLLAQQFPDAVAEKVITVLEKHLDAKEEYPYLFLFDFLYFIDAGRYQDRLLALLAHKKFKYPDVLSIHLADIQVREAIPIIRERMQQKGVDPITKNELKIALKKLETGMDEDAGMAKPYAELRDPWKEHYQQLEKIFYDDYEPFRSAPPAPKLGTAPQTPKIGRNEKVSVEYENGTIKRDVKYKKIEADLENGICWLLD